MPAFKWLQKLWFSFYYIQVASHVASHLAHLRYLSATVRHMPCCMTLSCMKKKKMNWIGGLYLPILSSCHPKFQLSSQQVRRHNVQLLTDLHLDVLIDILIKLTSAIRSLSVCQCVSVTRWLRPVQWANQNGSHKSPEPIHPCTKHSLISSRPAQNQEPNLVCHYFSHPSILTTWITSASLL